jgi:hypothetical protein
MRIGLFTAPIEYNNGTVIQAYALKTVLEKLGHTVTVIYPNIPWMRNCTEQYHNINKAFIEKYINPLRIESYDDLKEDMFDFLIVGAERVWMPSYMRMDDLAQSYLKFAKDWATPRISYATSFGTTKWNYSSALTNECKELIQLFQSVSVREEVGISLVKENLEYDNVVHLLDPVFLLSKEEWLSLIDFNTVKHYIDNNIFAYTFNRQDKEYCKTIAKDRDCYAFEFGYGININQWLYNLYTAKTVITDSYHGSVFRTIFGGEMIVYKNNINGEGRFDTIGDTLAASNNILERLSDYNPETNYLIGPETYEKLLLLKETSLNYLKNNLNSK